MPGATDYEINKGMELKFESAKADRESRVVCKVVEGQCEVFGTVLEKGGVVKFPAGSKGAIAAPKEKCKIQLMNEEKEKSTTSFWSGAMYEDFLGKMNDMRGTAKKNDTQGPRILICGPADSGKSTLCKYIINSAIRAGHKLSFTDCDLGQNAVTAPGSIASVFMEDQVDVEEGFTLLAPLAFFFGDLTLNSYSIGKYHHLCSQTNACIKANAENRREFLHGGRVVNTMGWVRELGYQCLRLIIEAMGINVVVCLNDDHLMKSLQNDLGKDKLMFFDFEKQNTVATRSMAYRKTQRGERVADYFRGCHTVLHPVQAIVPFSDLQLLTVGHEGQQHSAQQSSLPDYLKLVQCQPDMQQTLCLCAVSHASTREEVPHANVAGFVIILNVDLENSCFTLLMPSGSHPPKRFLILSKIYVSYEDFM